MNYTLSLTSKPGFPVITREDGLIAVFAPWPKKEGDVWITVRVPTQFGHGWRICGELESSSPASILHAVDSGKIIVPTEAWL